MAEPFYHTRCFFPANSVYHSCHDLLPGIALCKSSPFLFLPAKIPQIHIIIATHVKFNSKF